MEDKARTINVYAVKDELTGRFMQPIFFQGDKEAERWFTTQINNIPLWKSNAGDFGIYALGTFNEGTGEFVPLVTKIATGAGVVERS